MILEFWRNPEFVRHCRGELRPHRALAVAAVVLIICVLVGLLCWSYQQEMIAAARRAVEEFGGGFREQLRHAQRESITLTFRLAHQWLLILGTAILGFWCLFSCAQAVSGERDGKTWDFQRITRLSPGEILVGKLLGEPVVAYFAIACSSPLAIVAGILGGVPIVNIACSYVFLLANAVFLSLVGLCISTFVETRSRGVGLIGALGLYIFFLASYWFRESGLPGVAGLSPVLAIQAIHGDSSFFDRTPVFGHPVPWLVVSLLLQIALGAWLVFVLVRNLKREYEQIRPLSRFQAVACAAFLNVVIYALVRPGHYGSFRSSDSLAAWTVAINGILLLLMGVAILTPAERLRAWRGMGKSAATSLLSENGLPWPWLFLSAAAVYAVMIGGLLLWRPYLPLEADTIRTAGLRMLVVTAFVTSDVLFIQWCTLTHLRQPLVKGFLYICLYYASVLVVAFVVRYGSPPLSARVVTLLTPFAVFDSGDASSATSAYAGLAFQATGIVLQFVAAVGIVAAINGRLRRMPATRT
ncbi:MAG TPA: hypothetical protein VEF54_01265 [archaeon]|nr:hypothetical protein [archaeon]